MPEMRKCYNLTRIQRTYPHKLTMEIETLAQSLIDELVGAIALPRNRFWRSLAWKAFGPLMLRFAHLGLTFDHMVAEQGLPQASTWGLKHFCSQVQVRGAEHIPPEGPLLVTSNHPGAYDSLVIFSSLGRKDLKWISTEIPFLRRLPHISQRIFFAPPGSPEKGTRALLGAVRHLQSGGALLLFGAGHRDPDPASYPGAARMLEQWREGIELILRRLPDLRWLPVIVSGVVSPYWARHPITWLRRKQIDKQRLSEFGQVISQLLRPGTFLAEPKISFGPVATVADLRRESQGGKLLSAVIARQKELLREHCRVFGGDAG